MRKIKIVHLVNLLGFDGTSRVVQELCSLNPKLYEIEVVSLTSVVPLQDASDWPLHVKVTAFKLRYDLDYSLRRYWRLITFPWPILREAAEILCYLNTIRPDILHCHLQPRESVIAIEWAKRTKCKLVFTDHMFRLNKESYDLKTRLLAVIYRKVYRKFFVVAVSKKIFDSHRKNKLIDAVRGHRLVLNGIDTAKFFPPAERSSRSLRVIYVSRMEAAKGHDTLLDAWALLKVPYSLELILVGAGTLLTEYQARLALSRPDHNVVFAGERSNVAELLQCSHIAVFPSFREGMPLALLEMMSCGLPVIVSDIPELTELVDNGVNCLTFKAGNQNDLLEKLLLLIGNAELRNKLGQEARAHIEKNYSNWRMRNDYDDIYQKLMGE